MKSRSRPGRSMFLLFILSAYGAIFMAAPLVSALEPAHSAASARKDRMAGNQSASSGASSQPAQSSASRYPSFEQCDRNRDGLLDKSEAAAVPGLSANFERADTNKDGRLDREEFDRALTGLDIQK